jgi:hypothetical protein
VLEIHERTLRPELRAQFFSTHDLPRSTEQRDQNPQRLFLQRDAVPALAQLAGAHVQLERAEPDSAGKGHCLHTIANEWIVY